MGKIAFVFSGQGAQYSGMGKSFYDMGTVAENIYDEAEKVREGTKNQSFFGSEEELKNTANTQPCIYLAEMAGAALLNEAGIYADGVAGFSLGEIAALGYAKAYSLKDGFEIVTKRGLFMNEASKKADTAMCAVMKLDSDTVTKEASAFEKLYAVNYNCPGQTVVSGLKTSVDAFTKKVASLGGRVVPLAVSAAFHSPFMEDASEKFASALEDFEIKTPQIPVYANLTAKPYGDDVKGYLENQMKSPVKWQETIENMIADGYTDFIEVGPGKTLCGLIKKISKEVNVYQVQDEDTLNLTIEAVKGNA